MSGSTGANRIKKADVENTMSDYISKVLSKWPGYGGKFAYTGSFVVGKKSDYGDIDIVILAKGDDKKQAKKDFQKWLTTNYKDQPELLQPFTSPKYAGKLHNNTGELVTLKYPQYNDKTLSVQIDNMFAMTDNEFQFKQDFLNLPAEEQGIILGLTKIATIENDPVDLFKRLGIKIDPTLKDGEEWEFNLSPKELQLRKVQLDKNYRQTGRTIEWNSDNWGDVRKLLKGYNLKTNFKTLLGQVSSNLSNSRSNKRMIGIFKSMVTVKSGEVDTEKGMNKLRAIADIEDALGESNRTYSYAGYKRLNESRAKELGLKNEGSGKKDVNFTVGRFQPPTLGHLKVLEELYKQNKLPSVVVAARPAKRNKDKQPFDPDLIKRMFADLEKEYKFIEGYREVPTGSIVSIMDTLRPDYEPVLWGAGSDRVKGWQSQIDKYGKDLNASEKLKAFEITRDPDKDVSATKVRTALIDNNEEAFNSLMPKVLWKYYDELRGELINESELTAKISSDIEDCKKDIADSESIIKDLVNSIEMANDDESISRMMESLSTETNRNRTLKKDLYFLNGKYIDYGKI